ncbi:MAG: hypothetical protein HOV77_29270 [Hamadaea sp.]|uniref:hypothetical protein n=1 Tax=Hamadaea sp. TaxID=2024425 RepID=UPI0018133131|nr:hypothetical protein [Hamadaea sp.]NUT23280.1 hypothetical protein [Hamadaea sp.]
MTEVTAGQSVTLLGQFYDFEGGTLTDLDTTPTIAITAIATGATALAATATGVTHPATGSYGYAWTPASSLTPGAYLATWTGLKTGSPVTATETITVTAPATAEDTNTSLAGVWYATREDVQRALDVKLTARNSRQIDRALESASRDVDDLCHRKFAPAVGTRYFDWPGSQNRPSWRLWLDDNELISVTTLVSGGGTIPATDYLLEPNRSGPPYNRLEIDLDSTAAYSSGTTHQRAIQITGLWGYRNTETSVGPLAAAVASTTATTLTVTGAASAELGVGSVLRVDSERMLVTGRTMADTGQNVGGAGLTAQQNSVALAVADGSAFAVDEVLLVESERMLVVDIAGNTLTVQRAWDGTVLAAHAAGAGIYAPRTLTVQRGALGTTAALHADASSVVRWDPPGLVRDLTIAEALNRVTNELAGYARTRRAGGGLSSNDQALVARDLPALRQQVYNAHGRKGRTRGV